MGNVCDERLNWVDVFKGLAIILIVLGHVLRFGVLHKFAYYFHVPAFFFIAGVVAKRKEFNKSFVWTQFKRLMIPYYTFGIISIAVYLVLGSVAANILDVYSTNGILKNILMLLYGNSIIPFNAPLWFLPALFVTNILYQLLCAVMRTTLLRKNYLSIYLSIYLLCSRMCFCISVYCR